jgi:hypothetical protein
MLDLRHYSQHAHNDGADFDVLDVVHRRLVAVKRLCVSKAAWVLNGQQRLNVALHRKDGLNTGAADSTGAAQQLHDIKLLPGRDSQ